MIRCPACGTQNQDDRRACRVCGTALPQTKLRCPKCGALNSVGNLFCDQCNTRLVHAEDTIPPEEPESGEEEFPTSAVKGISLPSRLPSDIAEDDESASDSLPDWLSGLMDDVQPLDDAAEDETEETGTPSWLLDAGLDMTGNIEPQDPDEIPDWLRAGSVESDALTDESEDEPKALPDWLAAMAEESEPSLPEADDAYPDETLPDWLRGAGNDRSADEMPATADREPVADAHYEIVADDEAPVGPTEDDKEPLIFSESELPDWLFESQPEASQAAARQPASPSAGDEPADDAIDEMDNADAALPDWLLELSDDTVEDVTEDTAEEAIEALPSWLTELAPEVREAEAPDIAPAADRILMPDDGDEAVRLPTDEAPSTPDVQVSDDVPDWLAGLDLARTAPDDSFTGDQSIPAPSEAATGDILEEEEATAEPTWERLTSSDEEPAWLRGLRAGEETTEDTAAGSVFLDLEPTEAPVAFVEDDLSGTQPIEATDEIPAWLRDLDVGASEPSVDDVDTHDTATPPLARAELPPWLEELAPPEADDTGASGFEIHEGAEEGARQPRVSGSLTPADIPDWIEQLRPGPQEEGQPLPRRQMVLPTPAEPEGPLQGIPGVLPSHAMVDMATGTDEEPAPGPVLAPPLPESVIAQAQLWQQLLEQPRSVERPVAQQRPQRAPHLRVMRWIVAAILVIGILAAFWLVPEGLVRSLQPPLSAAQGAPGTTALVEGLDRLGPGDTVILAVEYTPAYADEMSQIAAPLLEHLNTRDVEVLIVSTLPEGTGLSYALTPQPRNRQTLTGSDYLAGNASGIAAFLNRSEAETARQLIILASDPQRFGWWIEQTTLHNQRRADAEMVISAGVSAATGPLVTPYLRSDIVTGWIAGFPQAAMYRDARGSGTGVGGTSLLGILTLAHWAVAALLLVAWIANLINKKGGG